MPTNIIDSIQLSGVTYTLSAQTSGGDVSSAITSGDTNAVAGGAVYDKFDEVEQVTAAALNVLNESLSGKQDTLSAGTNITIVDNVISAEGGGKAIEAGRGITVTTGATADTVSFNLPISAGTGTNSIIGGYTNNIASKSYAVALGSFNKASGDSSMAVNDYNVAGGQWSFAGGEGTKALGTASFSFGHSTTANSHSSFAIGYGNIAKNEREFNCGSYSVSNKANTTWGNSGNTLFSVGNGTSNSARHNAFEIRQNADIYISLNGQDVKLQDQLGGSSITVDSALSSTSENPVQNKVIYNKIDEVEQVTAAALNVLNESLSGKASQSDLVTVSASTAANTTALGGLSLVKLTQTQYDNLQTKDPSTLYVIVD